MSLFTADNPLECCVVQDDCTREIARQFDYAFDGVSRFHAPRMPMVSADYGIGLIVGPSGSGKSTALRLFGTPDAVKWDDTRAIASHFASADDARERLGAVGLNSIPTWLRPYHVCSTGEQFRADLARRLRVGAVIDEFTSVVDRVVAKACSHALRRYIDARGIRRVVLATCHYDVIEWLRPDWVFDTATASLTDARGALRPEIVMEVVPCGVSAWAMFRDHHYLSGDINPSAWCWLATWANRPVGFAAAIAFPNGAFRNAWRGHRTVILPDFQGLGLGTRLSDAIGEMMLASGRRYFSKTANHRLGEYRNASPRWRGTCKNGRNRMDYTRDHTTKEDGHKMRHAHRVCYSHEYIGGSK